MANNHPQPNYSLKAEADKYIAELNSQLSLLDSIHSNAASQKAQLVHDGHDLQSEAQSLPGAKSVNRNINQHPHAAKAASTEQDEDKDAAAAKTPLAISHLELETKSETHQKELSPASLQARLVDLEILVNGAEHEAGRLRAAIAARDPQSIEKNPHQIDFRLPQIEVEALKRTLQGPTSNCC